MANFDFFLIGAKQLSHNLVDLLDDSLDSLGFPTFEVYFQEEKCFYGRLFDPLYYIILMEITTLVILPL
jgi:hypothetical protein